MDAHIAIVGGGIAGLTAALCLSRLQCRVTVFEQAPQLDPIGAGVQLSPNATRILERLGLLPALEEVWHEPHEIRLVSGLDLKPIAHVPAGPFARRRWHAPYAVLHRADLQTALSNAVKAAPRCTLRLGEPVSTDDGLQRMLAERLGHTPDLIVAADGVWSKIRETIAGATEARHTGQIAWRTSVAAGDAADALDPSMLTAFLGPSTHLVAYPVRGATTVNLVAITHGRDPGRSWMSHGANAGEHLQTAFRRWHPRLRKLLGAGEAPTAWPIFEVPDGAWSDGSHTVLIGDAAHAMPPFAAQGAAMAIEDAWGLAEQFAAADGNAKRAIAGFVAARKPRIEKVRRRAAFNRFAYHASGPVRLGRDIVLALRSPQALAADFDWLYGG